MRPCGEVRERKVAKFREVIKKMSPVKEELLNEIEELSDKEVKRILAFLHALKGKIATEELLKDLTANGDFYVPRNLPPHFKKVKPAKGKGIPASQLLVQERR